MKQRRVVVFDYGHGNVHSVVMAFEKAGADVELTGEKERALNADALVVPGVGAFASVMNALRAAHGDQIIDRRLAGDRPVFGICVGMQVLFDRSLEFDTETPGMAEWPGVVDRLQASVVPHMGWNTVDPPVNSVLFDGVASERFYFVHSFAAHEWVRETVPPYPAPRVTWAEHGSRFIAAVEDGPLSATQFHPEKSGEAGIRLIENWLNSL